MKNVKVRLSPIVNGINLPTVLKTAVLPGDSIERLFIATQPGEIFYIMNGVVRSFLDIRSKVIQLGASGGYDERGLLGLAFHPSFYYNGLFYLHYSVAGTQGTGALPSKFVPNPCDASTLNLKWENRVGQFDHIDTVEEWVLSPNGSPQKRRILLNLRRPFANHNGVNSLNFSPETGKLVITTGDGGSGYDPFNLSQNMMEIAGKIIEMDVDKLPFIHNPPVVTRFNELPVQIQETLSIMAKGIRNIPGITFQHFYNHYVKYVGNVGQDLVESIFSFIQYKPISVTNLIQSSFIKSEPEQNGFINLGWRGWEGTFPTSILKKCPENPSGDAWNIVYFEDAVKTSAERLQPLTSYFHKDSRQDKFRGTALTGVQSYLGTGIPDLTESVVFTDLLRREERQSSPRGVIAYSKMRVDRRQNDFHVIDIDYDFGNKSAYYVSLGTNLNQTRLFLGVHGSMKVTDFNQGSVFEIIP